MGWLTKVFRRKPKDNREVVKALLSNPEILPDGFMPIQLNSTSLETLFESTAWSYACISANSREAASLGVQVQAYKDGQWIRTNHEELESFVRSPSGPQRAGRGRRGTKPPQWTWSQLIHLASMHLYLDGNSLFVPNVVRRGTKLYSMAPLIPTEVAISKEETGYPKEYKVGENTYRPDEVVHIMWTSPFDFAQGHAPIKAALRAMNIDHIAGERVSWNLENRASPGLVFTLKGLLGATDEQRNEFLDWIYDNYQASTKDGSPIVVGEGTGIEGPPNQSGPDYTAIRKAAQQEILATFFTPPSILGIHDHATRNNYETSILAWWRFALFPLLKGIYGALNTQLIHPIYGDKVRLWFDATDSEIAILQLNELADLAQKFVNMGYPPNIAAKRAKLEMPHVPELDAPLQNLALAGRDQGNSKSD